MPMEIERKFLVTSDDFKKRGLHKDFSQGYLCSHDGITTRIRIAGDRAVITIKGKTTGISRQEYEFPIPMEDAQSLLEQMCKQPIITKRRYFIDFEGFTWEVDEFLGENSGLIIAEIELTAENQNFPCPPWIGKDVSHLRRYSNANLVDYPFSEWTEQEKRGED